VKMLTMLPEGNHFASRYGPVMVGESHYTHFCLFLIAYFERFKPQNNPSRFISEPIEKVEYHLDYYRPLSINDVHGRTIGLAKSWRREYQPRGCPAGKALDQHMMGAACKRNACIPI
jgi:hypothetical protein